MRLLIFILLGCIICDNLLYQFFNDEIIVSFFGNPKWISTGEPITVSLDWYIDIIFSNKILPSVMGFFIYKISKNEVYKTLGISISILYIVKCILFMFYYLEEYNIPVLFVFFGYITYYLSIKSLQFKHKNERCQV